MSEEEKKYLTEDEIQTYENYCNGFTNSAYDDTLEHLIEARKKIEQLEKENKELKNNCKKCVVRDRLSEYVDDSIPKSVIREKIEEYLEEDKKYKRYLKDGRECFTFNYFVAKELKKILGGSNE